MRKKFLSLSFFFLLMLAVIVPFQHALAQGAYDEIGKQVSAVAGPNGAALPQPVDPRYTVVTIIRILLGLLGTVVFVFFIYAGFLWTTAGGSDEQVEQAKNIIKNATIGLIILLASYSITLAAIDLARGCPVGSSSNPSILSFFGGC